MTIVVTEDARPSAGRWFLLKSLAFVKRDFLFETSYKMQTVFRLLSVLFTIMTFYYLSQLVGEGRGDALQRYGGDYFTFALVGIAFFGFFNAGIINFTTSIRQQLTIGVLESMAATPVGSTMLLFYSLLWPMGFELARSFVFILIGKFVFGAAISLERLPLLLSSLVLSLLIFGSLGIIGGSLIVYFKKGDPIAWIASSLSSLIGGVLFPVTILPLWLRVLAQVNPITFALNTLRASLIPGATASGMERDLLVLGLFAVMLVPLAWWSARYLFEKARAEGSLGLY